MRIIKILPLFFLTYMYAFQGTLVFQSNENRPLDEVTIEGRGDHFLKFTVVDLEYDEVKYMEIDGCYRQYNNYYDELFCSTYSKQQIIDLMTKDNFILIKDY